MSLLPYCLRMPVRQPLRAALHKVSLAMRARLISNRPVMSGANSSTEIRAISTAAAPGRTGRRGLRKLGRSMGVDLLGPIGGSFAADGELAGQVRGAVRPDFHVADLVAVK